MVIAKLERKSNLPTAPFSPRIEEALNYYNL